MLRYRLKIATPGLSSAGCQGTAACRLWNQPVPVGSVAVPVSFGMNKISFQPFVIGVAGGSGSGKSTVSQQVLASFGAEMVSVVMQDDYYCDQTHLTPEVRRQQNYDHPQAFDWPLLVQHVQSLRNGVAIEMPEYDFTADNRSDISIATPLRKDWTCCTSNGQS